MEWDELQAEVKKTRLNCYRAIAQAPDNLVRVALIKAIDVLCSYAAQGDIQPGEIERIGDVALGLAFPTKGIPE